MTRSGEVKHVFVVHNLISENFRVSVRIIHSCTRPRHKRPYIHDVRSGILKSLDERGAPQLCPDVPARRQSYCILYRLGWHKLRLNLSERISSPRTPLRIPVDLMLLRNDLVLVDFMRVRVDLACKEDATWFVYN